MTIKMFWKEECPKCAAVKTSLAGFENVEYYDLGDPDGLAEAAFYSIMATPSVVISKTDGTEVVAFRGDVPSKKVLQKWL